MRNSCDSINLPRIISRLVLLKQNIVLVRSTALSLHRYLIINISDIQMLQTIHAHARTHARVYSTHTYTHARDVKESLKSSENKIFSSLIVG